MSIAHDGLQGSVPGRRILAGLIRRAAEGMQRRARIQHDRRLLQALPDRMLNDLGISRSEIASVTEYGMADPTRRERR